jgi:hypothetical protein
VFLLATFNVGKNLKSPNVEVATLRKKGGEKREKGGEFHRIYLKF